MNSTSSIERAALKGPAAAAPRERATIHPWQFYMTASFLAAAIAVWVSPPAPPVATIFLSLAIGAAGACAAALHALLVSISGRRESDGEITESIRASLEREKLLALRAIKDLQFDAAMGKVSAADAAPMEARLRERAAAIMRQLDSREALRARIEQEIARRQAPASSLQTPGTETLVCAACSTANDPDARFCKGCGAKL